MKNKGAAFSVVNGWERNTFYKPDADFVESHSYRFCNWHSIVEQEVNSLTSNVGIAELSGFNRYEITGEGAFEWLNSLTCTELPKTPGKVGLCYFLIDKGNLLSEATVTLPDKNRLWYGSAATAEYHGRDWLRERLPEDSNIQIKSLTNTHNLLVIAGPAARELLT